MTKSEVIEAYRGPGESTTKAVQNVADELRISRQAVDHWPERLVGPRLFAIQCALQVLSGGKVHADLADRVNTKAARELHDDEQPNGVAA